MLDCNSTKKNVDAASKQTSTFTTEGLFGMSHDSAPDLTDASARNQRDALATRTDVLDKVGVLRTLPDDMHVTTQMVAEFYVVDRETVLSVVKRNRGELDDDGYRVVGRTEFVQTFAVDVSSSFANSFALFPRRAVLRVGMLLRDSTIARQVRDYLLDTERSQMSDDEIVMRALQIQTKKVEALATVNRELTAKVEKDAPKVNYVDVFVNADDLLAFRTVAASLGIQEKALRELLLAKKWIYLESYTYWSTSKGEYKTPRRYSAFADKKPYFRPVKAHDAPRFRGEVTHTLKITPIGAEAIARLTVNMTRRGTAA